MRIIDLFAGAGGLGAGFVAEGYETILATDVDSDCRLTHEFNFPSIKYIQGDIRQIQDQIALEGRKQQIDCLIGGPPCKGFSTIGARASSKAELRQRFDDRNYLFKNFVHVVEQIKPKLILFENVSGLLTFNNGFIFDEIKNSFSSIGYNVSAHLIDAVHYAVPQFRKRVFIAANNFGIEISAPPTSIVADLALKSNSVGEAIGDLAGREKTFPNHEPLQHGEKNIARYRLIPEGGRLPEESLPPDLYRRNFGNTFKRLHRDKPALTMVPGHNAFPIHPWLDRSLTVREGARLQTFPDSFIFFGSRQSQCLQVGNAVPVNLARAWARHLKTYL